MRYRRSKGVKPKPPKLTDEERRQRQRVIYLRHRAKTMANVKMATQRDRAAAYEAYGNQCACCNERDWRFLTIDHIHGGGNEHKRQLGTRGSRVLYGWLRRNGYPSGFQILCWNCNSGRYRNGGTCPHEDRYEPRAISPCAS